MAKEKVRDITIIGRRAPRVAIQITEIVVDGKNRRPTRRTLDGDESRWRRSKENYHSSNREGTRSIGKGRELMT